MHLPVRFATKLGIITPGLKQRFNVFITLGNMSSRGVCPWSKYLLEKKNSKTFFLVKFFQPNIYLCIGSCCFRDKKWSTYTALKLSSVILGGLNILGNPVASKSKNTKVLIQFLEKIESAFPLP